jgi:hypothetical protein
MGDDRVTKRVEISVPEPVYEYLRRMAQANASSVGSEARTALVRGALLEWRKEELAAGAALVTIAEDTDLPLEVVMEALGPVSGEGSPLGGRG